MNFDTFFSGRRSSYAVGKSECKKFWSSQFGSFIEIKKSSPKIASIRSMPLKNLSEEISAYERHVKF